MSKTWKAIERKVAAYLGGIRVPITGRQRGDVPDVLHPVFSIEVKHRDKLPDWILEAMEQAEASQRDGQFPIAILHEKGQSIPDSLTVVRLSTILELLAKISELEAK